MSQFIHSCVCREGTLTLSAGIGIYEPGYPISAIAEEVGEQEEQSKKLPGKDAVTLMEDGQWHWDERGKHRISDGTYRWNEFEKKVLEEKYRIFCEFLFESEQQERGMNFVYHLLQLIRNQKESDYSGSPAHPGRSSAQPDRASAHLIRSAVQLMPVADQHTC